MVARMLNKFLFQMFLLISSVQFAYGVDEDYFIKSFYSLKVGQSVGPNLAFSFYNTDCSNEYGRTVVTNELDYTYDPNDFSFSSPTCASKDFFELSSLDCKLSQECQVNITVHPQTVGIKYARIDQTIKSTNTSISGEGGEVVSTNSYYQYFVYQYKVKTYEIDA